MEKENIIWTVPKEGVKVRKEKFCPTCNEEAETHIWADSYDKINKIIYNINIIIDKVNYKIYQEAC